MAMRILIAEDDPMALAMIGASLRELGYLVFEAADGEEAVRIFSKSRPDMVLSDWMMPGLSGVDLCRHIRLQPSTQYPYFIMLTGREAADSLEQAFEAGVDDFLHKPVCLESLKLRLRVAERVVRFGRNQHIAKTPIHLCATCHRVREEGHDWSDVAPGLERLTRRPVSHSCCPACAGKSAKNS